MQDFLPEKFTEYQKRFCIYLHIQLASAHTYPQMGPILAKCNNS